MKNKKKFIGSIVIFVLFLVFLAAGYYISRPAESKDSNDMFKENIDTVKTEAKTISVYVNGEVKCPGVYQLQSDSRVQDAVKASGGFTENADKTRLNLAKKLKDEDYIYVDTILRQGNSTLSNSSKGSDVININTASREELMTLPGIGEVTAQKIIDYREKNGGFSSVEDLKKVGRIGDKTLEKFKDKIEAR